MRLRARAPAAPALHSSTPRVLTVFLWNCANPMSDQSKWRLVPRRSILVFAALAIGVLAGLGIGRWENRVAQRAVSLLSEMRYAEAMSEESDQINRYWDSKPEVAQALLERELRSHERLLQTTKQFKIPRSLLTEEALVTDMALMHVRLASLCQRM